MPIRKFGDTGDDILLQCSLKSAAAVAAAGGTVVDTATMDDTGLNPGSAGSVTFTNYTGNAALQHEGQICFTATALPCCDADQSNIVSGSRGINLTAANYLLAGEDPTPGTDRFRLYMADTNSINMRMHSSETAITKRISSIGKGATIDFCAWWDGKNFGLLAGGDGNGMAEIIPPSPRLYPNLNSFYKLIVGAARNTTGTPFNGYRIKDLIVSRNSPRLALAGLSSIGFFGDSYVAQGVSTTQTTKYDNTVKWQLEKLFASKGLAPRVFGNGYSGYTVCDKATNYLSPYFAIFNATLPEIAVIMALNNDTVTTTASDAEYGHATTGSEARLKELILLLAANGRTRKLGITNPGSLRQEANLDTALNATRMAAINTMLDALPAWYLANKPANSVLAAVEILDLHAAMGGDVASNVNYVGHWNTIGNLDYGGTASPVATPNDRHPHASGSRAIAEMIYTFAR